MAIGIGGDTATHRRRSERAAGGGPVTPSRAEPAAGGMARGGGHDVAPGRAAPLLARALAALLALLANEARADAPRTLVLVRGPQERELAARVEGQTLDLGGSVEMIERALPDDLPGQIAAARAAGTRADVVIWFGAGAGDTVVYFAHQGRVVARRIEPAAGALSRSASMEAVALAVRTVLTGYRADSDAQRPAAAAPLRGWGELGGTVLLDGAGPSRHQGVALRGGVARGWWSLGAMLGVLPAARIPGAPATLELTRQHAGLLLGAELLPPGRAARWSLAVDLGLGVARYRRATLATGTGLVGTSGSLTWSGLVAPELRLARRVVSGAWLALEVGADVLTSPPRFGVQRSSGVAGLSSPRPVEPRAGLSLLLDWR
jgi:hypothetical protein